MSDPQHGTYREGWGYYDAGRRAYVTTASKLGPGSVGSAPSVTDYDRQEYAERQRQAGFTANLDLEQLRRLRDSNQPEQRAAFTQLATGRQRMALAEYEGNLRAHLASGGELPDGVAKPSDGTGQ